MKSISILNPDPRSIQRRSTRKSLLALAFGAAAMLAAQGAFAQSSLGSLSYELAGNQNESNVSLAETYDPNGNPATASITQSFSGLDGSNNPQTMTFSGTTTSSAQYGQLHVYTTGSLTNSYYNVNNLNYAGMNGTIANANGSPDSFASLGFATFSDTLQFGGVLVSGYQATYIFHVDGTNSGMGGASDLSVNVDSDPGQSFFDFNNGPISTDWVAANFPVNGVTPQQISVQFSDQVVFNAYQMADGSNAAGTSDFSQTLTLAGIELFDDNGNELHGWTVSSASGTDYPTIGGAPEPGMLPTFLALSAPALFMQWRRKRMAR